MRFQRHFFPSLSFFLSLSPFFLSLLSFFLSPSICSFMQFRYLIVVTSLLLLHFIVGESHFFFLVQLLPLSPSVLLLSLSLSLSFFSLHNLNRFFPHWKEETKRKRERKKNAVPEHSITQHMHFPYLPLAVFELSFSLSRAKKQREKEREREREDFSTERNCIEEERESKEKKRRKGKPSGKKSRENEEGKNEGIL